MRSRLVVFRLWDAAVLMDQLLPEAAKYEGLEFQPRED